MPPLRGDDDGTAGYGVFGVSNNFIGVRGWSDRGPGVDASSDKYSGVIGRSYLGTGVTGLGGPYGVFGRANNRDGSGVYGVSAEGNGVVGIAYRRDANCFGVIGNGSSSPNGYGVYGISERLVGVLGYSAYGSALRGESGEGNGVVGICWRATKAGVSGYSIGGVGVSGESDNSVGVSGYSDNASGVSGISTSLYGVYAYSRDSYGLYVNSGTRLAAYLDGTVTINGDLRINGNISKGGGSFKIDHPLDPANKYLSHSFVESPDMKNVYDGVVSLDGKGEAEIELPDWFGALNKDFRYQLTAIGAPGPNLHIAEEISDTTTISTSYSNSSSRNNNNNNNSHFKIAGGTSGMKVSWQVTGIRKDPWANAHRIDVEEDKPAKEQGYYIHPDLYGQPEEKGISQLLFPREEKWQEVPVR